MTRVLRNGTKHKDIEVIKQEVFVTGYGVLAIGAIDEGTAEGQGRGDSILVKSIQIKAQVEANANPAALDCQPFRMLLVQDTQTNGKGFVATGKTEPEWDISDLLAVGGLGEASTAPRNLNETGRFRVLKEKTFMMNKNTGSSKQCQLVNFSKYFKSPIKVQYKQNRANGNIANVLDNSLWLVCVADATVASTHGVNFRAQIRCKYLD